MDERQVEIRSVIHFLWMKGCKNQTIYQEICSVYGTNSISLRSIQDRTNKMKKGTHSIFDQNRTGRPKKSALIPQIQNYLKENPYSSTRNIAKHMNADKKTVKFILVNELHMKQVNFKWIPHVLTSQNKAIRVEMCTKLLEFLSNANNNKLRKVLTQDESWIYFSNPRNSMWIHEDDKIPQRVSRKIDSKKVMISVIWSITGIKSITMLGRDQKFNRVFFSETVLKDLSKKISTKGYYLHMDNARPHLVPEKLKELGIKRLEHPPYSPDVAPSDFFLFGYLKDQLQGCEFEDEEQLFEKVSEILYSIPKSTLERVYNEWMERLFKVIETNGNYI